MTHPSVERVRVALEQQNLRVTGSGDKFTAQCPAHDDRAPSLSVGWENGLALLKCHAHCPNDQVVAALGLTFGDLYDEPLPDRARGAVREHVYQRRNRSVVGVVQRFEPKTFRPLTLNGRRWRQQATDELKVTPYRLPEVLDAIAEGRVIYVTEGERDADTVFSVGAVGTCNQGGAGKWTPEHAQYLAGADVVVVRDVGDDAGRRHGDQVVQTLLGVARSIKLVEPAGYKDLTEHISAGHTLEDLTLVDLGDEVERYSAAHLPDVPDYPVDALVGPLRDLVVAGVESGLDPALVGGAGLAALATVCGLADLEISPTWTERPVVWVPLVAPRGAGKSPAQQLAFAKVHELDAAAHEIYRAELETWVEIPRKDRAGTPRPSDPTRRVDDVTIEMIARHLARGDGTAGIEADELSSWLKGLGRYRATGDGGERARWLSLWSHRPWRYMRVSDDIDLSIQRPVVSICGGLQPPLHHLLGGDEDGFRPRWLPHIGRLDPSRRHRRIAPVDSWDKTIDELYRVRQRRVWTLEGAAYTTWQQARERWKQQAEDHETPSTSAALVKADVQCARIALVLAESLLPAAGGLVPIEAVEAAITVTDYAMDCWRSLPEFETLTLSRRDERLQQAVDQLSAWLEQHGGSATRRDLLRAHVAGARTMEELNALLDRYDAVYPGSVRREKSGRGRPGVRVYAPRRGNSLSSAKSKTLLRDFVASDKVQDGQIGDEPAGQVMLDVPGLCRQSPAVEVATKEVATKSSTQSERPADDMDPALVDVVEAMNRTISGGAA